MKKISFLVQGLIILSSQSFAQNTEEQSAINKLQTLVVKTKVVCEINRSTPDGAGQIAKVEFKDFSVVGPVGSNIDDKTYMCIAAQHTVTFPAEEKYGLPKIEFYIGYRSLLSMEDQEELTKSFKLHIGPDDHSGLLVLGGPIRSGTIGTPVLLNNHQENVEEDGLTYKVTCNETLL